VGHLSVKTEVTTAKGVVSSKQTTIVCSSCGGSGSI
jgi:hypothetical protein